ncbi:MAG: ComF family protein [Rhizobiales bacterium]|nr:ComF family protein [Hyphomicrobiales bacterium]
MDEAAAQSTYSVRAWGRRFGRQVIDFLAPPKCLVCHDAVLEPASLCLSCWANLKLIDAPVCNVLGIPFAYDQGEGAISPAALAEPPTWDRARAAVAYDEASRRIVHALKYRDTMEAGLLMARLMARAGQPLIGEADVIIPVPLHRFRLWGRRFNQAAFLSQQISRQFGKAYRSDVLKRNRATRSQVGLSSDERRKNVAKVFQVMPEAVGHIAGRRVLLVDDVLTTGATAGSCAAVMKKSGAAHVDVLTFALVLEPKRPHIG